MFRQTIICHGGLPVNFRLTVESLRAFRFGCGARAEEKVEIASVAKQRFVASDGASLTTDHPISKAALHHLIDIWPRTATFEELYTFARNQVGGTEVTDDNQATDAEVLASNLLNGFIHSARLVVFTMHEPHFVIDVSERPIANPWARLIAPVRPLVTTMRHQRYSLDPHEQFILPLLEGTNTVEMIVEKLISGPVATGELAVQRDEQTVTDPAEMRTLLDGSIRRMLNSFAHAALLIG
jgi:methyltransferase-like protein